MPLSGAKENSTEVEKGAGPLRVMAVGRVTRAMWKRMLESNAAAGTLRPKTSDCRY